MPYSVYVYRSSWSKLVIFAHNFVIYFGVLLYFQIWPGAVALLAIPGLLLVLLNGAVATLLIGMVSARFRDIPQIDQFDRADRVLCHADHVEARTAAHAILYRRFQSILSSGRSRPRAAARADAIDNTYLAVLLITLINLVVAGAFFARFRSRISYWV